MKDPGYNIIDEFRKGNKRAFSHIYNKYNSMVFYIAQKYIPHKDTALDVAAECFVKLWQKAADFESEDHIKHFLITVTRNASIDHLRAQKNKQNYSVELLEELPEVSDGNDTVKIEADAYDVLYSSIELLPKKCRSIVRLILLGQTTDEIASRFKISPKTVRNQKARAIELLKNIVLKDLLLIIIISITLFYLTKNTSFRQQTLLFKSFGDKMVRVENPQP